VAATSRFATIGWFRDLLQQFLQGGAEPSSVRNEALVIILPPSGESTTFDELPSDRSFRVPSVVTDGRATWASAVRGELTPLLDSFDESQTLNPNVGFGVLLLTSAGYFFLMERRREPGKGQLGTFGGNFERGQSLESTLQDVLRRRLRKNSRTQVKLGPLLACTNMKNGYYHYVDLTFLAFTPSREVRDVSDKELRPVSDSLLSELFPKRTCSATHFTLAEMLRLHHRGVLFRPVSNAFEAFCRTVLAHSATQGMSPTWPAPSLQGNGDTLEVPVSFTPRTLAEAVQGLPSWSSSPLPFFESGF